MDSLGIGIGDEAFFEVKVIIGDTGIGRNPRFVDSRTKNNMTIDFKISSSPKKNTDDLIPNLTLTENFLPST